MEYIGICFFLFFVGFAFGYLANQDSLEEEEAEEDA